MAQTNFRRNFRISPAPPQWYGPLRNYGAPQLSRVGKSDARKISAFALLGLIARAARKLSWLSVHLLICGWQTSTWPSAKSTMRGHGSAGGVSTGSPSASAPADAPHTADEEEQGEQSQVSPTCALWLLRALSSRTHRPRFGPWSNSRYRRPDATGGRCLGRTSVDRRRRGPRPAANAFVLSNLTNHQTTVSQESKPQRVDFKRLIAPRRVRIA
jgi:hypothetical protein